MIESTKAGKVIVAIDGCLVACAKKTLEHAGFNIDEYVQVTDLGIEKNHNFDLDPMDVGKVADYLVARILKRRWDWYSPEDFIIEKDYRLVLVGNTQVGLIGLKEIFEELKRQRRESESALKEMLIERTGKKNYIPDSIKEKYGKALLREFKKFLGEKVAEERGGFLEVAILGPGCYSCNKLE